MENKFIEDYFNKTIQRILNAKDYLLFSCIIVLCLAMISIVLIYISYTSYERSTQRNLEMTANRVDNLFTDILEDTSSLIVYIGKQIVHQKADLKFISHLLKNTEGKEYNSKNVLQWTIFGWMGPENNLHLVNSKQGIVNNPTDMSDREYSWKSRKIPWTLQVSKPAVGVPTGVWVIPAGMGVTDNLGKLLGIITLGLNIEEVTIAIENKLSGSKESFIVIDDKSNIVLQSSDNISSPKDPSSQTVLRNNMNHFNKPNGSLPKSILYNDIEYSIYKRMSQFPYTVVTGIDRGLFIKGFQILIVPTLVELWVIGALFLVLLYFYRKRVISLSLASDRAREEFCTHINQKLGLSIDTVLEYSNILLRFLKGKIEIGINKEKQIQMVSNIYEAALNMKGVTTISLDLSDVDINKIITESIVIHSKEAFHRNILIRTNLQHDLPFIQADELRMKQIILGLLHLAIEYTQTGGSVNISTSIKTNNYKKILIITVQDDGFGLSENDIIRINKSTQQHKIIRENDGIMDLPSILRLIKLHTGSYEAQNVWGEGRIVVLSFPYEAKETSLDENLVSNDNEMENDLQNIQHKNRKVNLATEDLKNE